MNAFNPQQFSALLKKLVGDRKVQDFAEEAGLSKHQISRRLSGSLDTPPRIKTLKILASHAANGVTYEELLSCCGYEPDLDDPLIRRRANAIKLAKACVLSSINDLDLPVRLSAGKPSLPCDFELTVGADPEVTWGFKYLAPDMPQPLIEKTVDENYLTLMYARLCAYSKMSFLTSSRKAFSVCKEKAPVNLNVNISVVLYAPEDLEVISEALLTASKSEPIPDNVRFLTKN